MLSDTHPRHAGLQRAAAALVACSLLAARTPAQIAFGSPPVPPSLTYEAIADVNGDGILDICGKSFGAPAVYPGLGGGTYGALIGSSGPLSDGTFLLGDLNGDGRADLVEPHVYTPPAAALNVRLAQPDGTFAVSQLVLLPHVPGGIQIVDLQGDGVPDLLVSAADWKTKRLMLLFGHGDGSFEPPVEMLLPTQSKAGVEVVVGDLNGDHHPDLVMNRIEGPSDPLPGITALFGHGDGSFAPAIVLSTATVDGMRLGDVLGAGRDAIVYGNTGAVHILQLEPHAGLVETLIPVPGLIGAQNLKLAQIVAGLTPEIVVISGPYSGQVLRNDGNGVFTAAPPFWLSGGLVAIDDVDHDGAPDLISQHGLALGQGDGSFQPWYFLPAVPRGLDTADLDGDGHPDVVTVFEADAPPQLHRGRLDGTLEPPVSLDLGPSPARVRLLDVIGGPHVDALVFNGNEPYFQDLAIAVCEGFDDGSFAPPVLTPVDGFGELSVADFNEDGRTDVLMAPTIILLNTGDGHWSSSSVPSELGVLQATAGDVDGDGHDDIVRMLRQPANLVRLQVLLGQGDGTFVALPSVPSGVGFVGPLSLVQLDADGIPDLVFSRYVPFDPPADGNGGALVELKGLGGGSFGAAFGLAPAGASNPVFSDFDGDGHLDMLTSGLDVTGGSAEGLTTEVTHSPTPSEALFVVADFNGDGITDAAGIGSQALMLFPRAPGVWQTLGHSLAGAADFSKLQGVGSLQPGSAAHLLVKHAPPSTPMFLVLGLRAADVPLHGGLLVPSPDVIVSGLLTDGVGAAALAAHWPAGVPAGIELFAQAWFPEGGSVFGATNAVVGTTQP